MRITGGRLCGRRISVPEGKIRPTQDRVREALFSILGSQIAGARFLDLFAGSGIVGIEAWSRGADAVCWVERETRSLAGLKRNVTALCDGVGPIVCGEALRFLDHCVAGEYDIVFCDPPYQDAPAAARVAKTAGLSWPRAIMETLGARRIMRPQGVAVFEQAAEAPLEPVEGWSLTADRKYGSSRLRFFMQN